MTDKQLVQNYLAGDERSFTKLFEKHNKNLVQALVARTGFLHNSEDAVQSSWLRLLPKLKSYLHHEPFSVSGLLSSMAYRAYIDMFSRGPKSRVDYPGTLSDEGTVDAEPYSEPYSEHDIINLRENILNLKNEQQKETMVLRTYKGMKFKDITYVVKFRNTNSTLAAYRYAFLKIKKMMDGSKPTQEIKGSKVEM